MSPPPDIESFRPSRVTLRLISIEIPIASATSRRNRSAASRGFRVAVFSGSRIPVFRFRIFLLFEECLVFVFGTAGIRQDIRFIGCLLPPAARLRSGAGSAASGSSMSVSSTLAGLAPNRPNRPRDGCSSTFTFTRSIVVPSCCKPAVHRSFDRLSGCRDFLHFAGASFGLPLSDERTYRK